MFRRKLKVEAVERKPAVDVLIESHPWLLSEAERAKMTISCDDTANIPKVPKAGSVSTYRGQKIQLMHNGLKVVQGGYYGGWMVDIIKELKGHHEPQEEKAFYEVMNRLKATKKKQYAMIELGSFWAYYSLWFKKVLGNSARAYGFEPDPENLKIGQQNAALNDLDVSFEQAAAGSQDGTAVSFRLDHDPTRSIDVEIRSVDAAVEKHKLKYVDILHMDVQGAEVDALEGAAKLIAQKKLRFLFVSTHHYMISKDFLSHQKCLDFITEHGGHIITEHNILESYSGDGLIVASFDKADKDFTLEISRNSSQSSLFRAYERDLAILAASHDENQS